MANQQPFVVNFDLSHGTNPVASLTSGNLNTTSGNLLVAIPVVFGTNIGASPITDNKSNTWLTAVAAFGTGPAMGCFYAKNCIGGSGHNITFTPSPSSDYAALVFVEIQQADQSSPLGNSSTNSSTGTGHSAGVISAGAGGPEVFVGAVSHSHAGDGFPSSWLSNLTVNFVTGSGSQEGVTFGFCCILASGSSNFTIVLPAANQEVCMVVGFKGAPVSGGGGATSLPFIGMMQ